VKGFGGLGWFCDGVMLDVLVWCCDVGCWGGGVVCGVVLCTVGCCRKHS
jgi:hypothetical protein